MHNTQSRLPVNDNDVITLGATIGTFEAVVFFFLRLIYCSEMYKCLHEYPLKLFQIPVYMRLLT